MWWLTATEMVCVSPSFVSSVVKCRFVVFFYNNGMGRKGVVTTLRCFRISDGLSLLKHVNRIKERDLELKQLRLKFFEIKLISAINGNSHSRVR